MVLGLLWVISVGGSVGTKVDDTATTLELRGTLPPPRHPWPKPWVSCMVSLLSAPQTNRGSAFLTTLQPSLASVPPVPHSSGLVTSCQLHLLVHPSGQMGPCAEQIAPSSTRGPSMVLLFWGPPLLPPHLCLPPSDLVLPALTVAHLPSFCPGLSLSHSQPQD